MNVFVTGGSGFIGGHLIEHLRGLGHQVRALARSEKAAEAVRRAGATPVAGALGSLEASQLAGSEVVVHAAAMVGDYAPRQAFVEGNVEGTRRALAAARQAGVARFVHVGTEAALFNGADLENVDETAPYAQPQRFLYSETKAEAERLVLAASGPGFTALSIRPRLVWGPRDTTVLPVVLELARQGRWRWIDGGRQRTSTTHVANLVHALALALDHGRGGQAYFVADDGVRTIREVFTALAATQGVQLPEGSIPGWLARGLGVALEGAWRLVGARSTPPLTRFSTAIASASVTVRTDKARRELGWAPVLSFEAGLAGLRAP